VCRFCFNSIKNEMNNACPACRRPYNDKDVQYKAITPEEIAAYKSRQAQKQKKTQATLAKEKQKAEAEHLSRKHLAGMRVVQKNLVYVTGLSPTTQEDQLLATLRGDQYFGQYGKIVKIVVSKAKDPSHPQSVGVYVTFERKEDAAQCISAVNGSKNGDRTLRAQFGTTKYCSAYLRGETCTNRQCMFLHEPGEANESYSRADLSALNAGSSQHGSGRPPPPQSQQPVASATQPMERQGSDQSHSPATDRPALPSHASWASKPLQQPSRTESRSTSGAQESPALRNATPAPVTQQPEPAPESVQQPAPAPTAAPPTQPRQPKPLSPLQSLIKGFNVDDLKFTFNYALLSETDQAIIRNYPPLCDSNGGAGRRIRRQREEEQRRMEQEAQAFQEPPPTDTDDNPEMSGSLVLGGEPENDQRPGAVRDGGLDSRFQFGGATPGLSDRALTPQQHQQLLLQTMKSNDSSSIMNNLGGAQSGFPQQPSAPPGHQRNVSRFSFANDTSASTSVKPVANQKLLNQQSSLMASAGQSSGGQQGQFYTSNVQGPPPGLKTTGTPPVSGGMTFAQGHGFATGGLQYNAGAAVATAGRNANEEMMRSLLRGGNAAGGRGEFMSSPPATNFNSSTPVAGQQQQFGYGSSSGLQGPASVFSDGERSQGSTSATGNGGGHRGKKKGKKHGRSQGHNNTSSTSSGFDVGVVGLGGGDHLLQGRFQAGLAAGPYAQAGYGGAAANGTYGGSRW